MLPLNFKPRDVVLRPTRDCVCVCVCVCEREREGEKVKYDRRDIGLNFTLPIQFTFIRGALCSLLASRSVQRPRR